MTAYERTENVHFDVLEDWPYEPRYHVWEDLRVHYVDEGPADGPVVLLTHGMPTWGYLYRSMIPGLVAAGFRCVAPDHLGFGRSDKPTDRDWYSIARHAEVLSSLIEALDLRDVTLVCQDWGGPIGLAQAATMPDRFSRLIIMNTWLHHPGFEYTDAIHTWITAWRDGGLFDRQIPNAALVPLLSAGVADRGQIIEAIVSGREPDFVGDAATMYAGFAAPFRGLTDAAFNGVRMFPLSIPVTDAHSAGAATQTAHYESLLAWPKPVHFVWGGSDDVFTETWGRTWAERMGGSYDLIPDAHHFLQNTHGPQIVEIFLQRIGEEAVTTG